MRRQHGAEWWELAGLDARPTTPKKQKEPMAPVTETEEATDVEAAEAAQEAEFIDHLVPVCAMTQGPVQPFALWRLCGLREVAGTDVGEVENPRSLRGCERAKV